MKDQISVQVFSLSILIVYVPTMHNSESTCESKEFIIGGELFVFIFSMAVEGRMN